MKGFNTSKGDFACNEKFKYKYKGDVACNESLNTSKGGLIPE
jgi:hypothetical protein